MRRRGYTLVEVLIVVTILGILASLVVPAMGGTQTLRTQAAVRTLVADITEAQSEALAHQRRRAIVFYAEEARYVIVDVLGDAIDVELNVISETQLKSTEFGDVTMKDVDFDGDGVLIFDELGSPVTTAGGAEPSASGVLTISGGGEVFTLTVEAFTGRVTVRRE